MFHEANPAAPSFGVDPFLKEENDQDQCPQQPQHHQQHQQQQQHQEEQEHKQADHEQHEIGDIEWPTRQNGHTGLPDLDATFLQIPSPDRLRPNARNDFSYHPADAVNAMDIANNTAAAGMEEHGDMRMDGDRLYDDRIDEDEAMHHDADMAADFDGGFGRRNDGGNSMDAFTQGDSALHHHEPFLEREGEAAMQPIMDTPANPHQHVRTMPNMHHPIQPIAVSTAQHHHVQQVHHHDQHQQHRPHPLQHQHQHQHQHQQGHPRHRDHYLGQRQQHDQHDQQYHQHHQHQQYQNHHHRQHQHQHHHQQHQPDLSQDYFPRPGRATPHAQGATHQHLETNDSGNAHLDRTATRDASNQRQHPSQHQPVDFQFATHVTVPAKSPHATFEMNVTATAHRASQTAGNSNLTGEAGAVLTPQHASYPEGMATDIAARVDASATRAKEATAAAAARKRAPRATETPISVPTPTTDNTTAGTPENVAVATLLSRKISQASTETTYVLRIHHMLEDTEQQGHQDIVSWLPHGRAFKIHKPKQFVDAVLPKFFKAKMNSFQRWLRAWGFARATEGPDRGAWYHRYFVRGATLLCRNLSRVDMSKAMENWVKAGCSPNLYTCGKGGGSWGEQSSGMAGRSSQRAGASQAQANVNLATTGEHGAAVMSKRAAALRGKILEDVRQVLYDAEQRGKTGIVSWMQHGRAFKIHDRQRFEKELMPKHFRSCKKGHLVDTLRLWGFKKIKKGRDKGALYHVLFVRNAPVLCRNKSRQEMKDVMQGHLQTGQCPDFYAPAAHANNFVRSCFNSLSRDGTSSAAAGTRAGDATGGSTSSTVPGRNAQAAYGDTVHREIQLVDLTQNQMQQQQVKAKYQLCQSPDPANRNHGEVHHHDNDHNLNARQAAEAVTIDPQAKTTTGQTETATRGAASTAMGQQTGLATRPPRELVVTNPNPEGTYIVRIHEMLQEAQRQRFHHIVSWCIHGRAFKIHKRKEFEERIMPKYFKAKIVNFERWLRAWGFERVREGRDRGAWYHRYFVHGLINLCRTLSRSEMMTAMKEWLPDGGVPDFYRRGGAQSVAAKTRESSSLANATEGTSAADAAAGAATDTGEAAAGAMGVATAENGTAANGDATAPAATNHAGTSTSNNKVKQLRGKIPESIRSMIQDADEEGNASLISWCRHGYAFQIPNKQVFANVIMPRYFKAAKFAYLGDALRVWGWHRIRKGIDKGAYFHRLFVRGKPELSRNLSRAQMRTAMSGFDAERLPNLYDPALTVQRIVAVCCSSASNAGGDARAKAKAKAPNACVDNVDTTTVDGTAAAEREATGERPQRTGQGDTMTQNGT